jgi:hypothetical protein
MKKSLVIGAVILMGSLSAFAAGITGLDVDESKFSELHQAGWAIQIAEGVDIAYYTDNHEYTFGFGGLTYTTQDDDNNEFNPGFFARKNMAFTTNTTIGLSVNLGTTIGEIDGKSIEDALNTKAYVFFEYAATKNILIGASVGLFKYSTQTVNDVETSEKQFMNGSNVQLAVLF